MIPPMLSLTEPQLKIVTDAASGVSVEKRDTFLRRTAMMLALRGRFDDADVVDVTSLALCGLVHQRNDAA